MKFHLIIIVLFIVITSCKSEKKDLESNKKIIDVYTENEKFENKESEKFNLEGIELAKKNEYEKAQIKFLKALNIEINNPTILNNLGNVKKFQKKYKESIVYYEKSLIVSDSLYLNSALNLGIVTLKIKDYDKSLKILEYVISQTNNLELIEISYFHLILVHLELNDCEKAKTELKKSEEMLESNFQYIEQHEYLKTKIKNCVQHRI